MRACFGSKLLDNANTHGFNDASSKLRVSHLSLSSFSLSIVGGSSLCTVSLSINDALVDCLLAVEVKRL